MPASFQIPNFFGCAMAQAISRRPVTSEASVQYQNILYGICGGQIATGTGFPVSNFRFMLSVLFHQCSIIIFHSPTNDSQFLAADSLSVKHF